MEKRYWIHEPVKGTQEIYNSDDWWSVELLWFFAKIIGIGLILGVLWLFSLFA